MVEVSNAELRVMQVLWQRSPQTAQEIVGQLQQEFDWHEKTIKTMLSRLTQKNALTTSLWLVVCCATGCDTSLAAEFARNKPYNNPVHRNSGYRAKR